MITSQSSNMAAASPPALMGLAANQGPITGGTKVTLTGTNLSGARAVNFGAQQPSSPESRSRHLDSRCLAVGSLSGWSCPAQTHTPQTAWLNCLPRQGRRAGHVSIRFRPLMAAAGNAQPRRTGLARRVLQLIFSTVQFAQHIYASCGSAPSDA